MIHAKNYETVSTFVEVMQRKLWPLSFQTRCTTHINKPWVNVLCDHSARSRMQQLTKFTMSEEKHKILIWQTALSSRHTNRHTHTYNGPFSW